MRPPTLVTGDVLKTKERIEKQRKDWDEEGETRLEPGGALLLVGQRMGPDDLFGYCLDQKLPGGRRRYRHVVYPAHDDDNCTGEHGSYVELDDDGTVLMEIEGDDPKPWPEGCLLDPSRIPWYGAKGLYYLKESNPSVYEIQYQQRGFSSTDVLVNPAWIHGGIDPLTGEHYPGCWDRHRKPGTTEGLRGLVQPYYSFVTVDPSPSNYWAVIWWIYHPATEQLFLLDLFNDPMDGSDLLDFNALDAKHFGLLEEWRIRASAQRAPISHVILEFNVAQKWLMQFQHARTWATKNRIQVIPHTTGTNKLDQELGVQSVAPLYRFGNIRLPGAGSGPALVENLIREATRYETSRPKAHTDDTLMATWFARANLQKLHRPKPLERPKMNRPSFVSR